MTSSAVAATSSGAGTSELKDSSGATDPGGLVDGCDVGVPCASIGVAVAGSEAAGTDILSKRAAVESASLS